MSGVLYGLGLGPGDPDLVTIKAAAVLADITVIAYVTPLKNAAAGASFARAIAAPHLGGEKIEITIPIAMNENPAPGQLAYDQASREIAGHLDAGRDVAVLCEGDPLLYGSFMYVLERLNESYKIVTVPGVSSLGAAAAAANLPLVSRHQSLAVVPATLPEAEIKSRIAAANAAAVFKVGRNMAKVKRVLDVLGRMDGAIYIERASLPEVRVLPLADAPDDAPYFSMILTTET
ncbi:MAG: precorrin-2 C(20)-methyltransferase [Rhodospirillales bacterium]|nr:precorrin-2 C(20)-methyltransferase [Rhodospirillales bacterium]MBL6941705.1 precorrin-2 C(20)-methyltransferase [Rhodospirillales bacterium]